MSCGLTLEVGPEQVFDVVEAEHTDLRMLRP